MPVLPSEIHAEDPRSRFTLRPAFAVLVGEEELVRYEDESLAADEAAQEVLGSWLAEDHDVLGEPRVLDGSFGRGADGWAPVIDWLVQPAVAGVIGALSWELTKIAGRKFRELAARENDSDSHGGVVISRGGAGFIAAALLSDDPAVGDCVIHAIEEPSSIAGEEFLELNYVGIEPWIVLAVDLSNSVRHLVVVSASGEVRGHLAVPMEKWEAMSLGFLLPDT